MATVMGGRCGTFRAMKLGAKLEREGKLDKPDSECTDQQILDRYLPGAKVVDVSG